FGVDEVPAAVAPAARVDDRVHADGVTRARADAPPAVDALQRIDLVAHGVLLGVGIGVLARLDMNTLRGTRRRAEEAGRAADRPVWLERQAVRAAVALGIHLPLLGILHGDRRPPVAREAEHVEHV